MLFQKKMDFSPSPEFSRAPLDEFPSFSAHLRLESKGKIINFFLPQLRLIRILFCCAFHEWEGGADFYLLAKQFISNGKIY